MIQNLDLSQWVGKSAGDELPASAWNSLFGAIQAKVNELVSASGNAPASPEPFTVNGVVTAPVNGIVTLAAKGNYILKGMLNGQVVIGGMTEMPDDDTHITLDGVTIVNSDTHNAGIAYIAQSQTLQVTLAKNSVNIIDCNHAAEMAEQQWACLYSENNMIVQGSGYLVVRNLGGHGVKASELRISGHPHIYASAIHDGIHGNSKLRIDGGCLYVDGANDAFGTGSTGSIHIFGGEYWAYNLHQKVFDSKVGGYFYANVSVNTDATTENVSSGMTKVDPKVYFGGAVQDNTNGGYTTQPTGTVKCYTALDPDTGDLNEESATVIEPVDGVYTLTAKYARISGYVEGKVTTSIQSTDLYLTNAYLVGDVEYTASKKKLQINAEKDTTNYIVGNVKSGSNLAIEFKGGSYIQIDGNVTGDELTINDSKGVLVVNGDVQGKDIYIGTQATVDPTKMLQGAFVVNGTLRGILNSKFVKGTIHVSKSNLLGICIAEKIEANGSADLDNSNNVFYNESVGVIYKSLGVTVEPQKIIAYGESVVFPKCC